MFLAIIPKDWNKVMFIFNQSQKYYNSFINTNLKIYFILEIKAIYKTYTHQIPILILIQIILFFSFSVR